MTEPGLKIDYEEEAIERLLSIFQGDEEWESLVTILVERVQDLETVAFDLVVGRMLDTAQGAQLDQYGDIVGQPRSIPSSTPGLELSSDEEYRRVIKIRIQANRSNGEAAIIQDLSSRLVEEEVAYSQMGHAGFQLAWSTPTPTSQVIREVLMIILNNVIPAGVELALVVEGTEGAFGWEDDPDALGFGVGEWGADIIDNGTY